MTKYPTGDMGKETTHQLLNRVKPFIGFGPVRFGSTREEVKRLLGEPNHLSNECYDAGKAIEHWQYDTLKVSLSFYEDEGYKLGAVSFSGTDYDLSGIKLIGMSEDQLLEHGKTGHLPEPLLDDSVTEMRSRSYEISGMGIVVWCAGSTIEEFSLYPLYDEGGKQPIWPAYC